MQAPLAGAAPTPCLPPAASGGGSGSRVQQQRQQQRRGALAAAHVLDLVSAAGALRDACCMWCASCRCCCVRIAR